MESAPPETVTCIYCGAKTSSYQLVSQVPREKCTQSFVKSELVGVSGTAMKDDDYICFDHEETFRIKFLQHKRELTFSKGYMRPNVKIGSGNIECAICSSTDSHRYHRVGAIKTLSLKNFVINEMQMKGQKATRKGSGISESDHLCHSCYESIRRNIVFGYYSPPKKMRKISRTSGDAAVIQSKDKEEEGKGEEEGSDLYILQF